MPTYEGFQRCSKPQHWHEAWQREIWFNKKNDVMRNIYMTREYLKTLVTLMQIVVANKSTTHRSKLELV
jgi:hypothetical protein